MATVEITDISVKSTAAAAVAMRQNANYRANEFLHLRFWLPRNQLAALIKVLRALWNVAPLRD
jgi:hypothetical protein